MDWQDLIGPGLGLGGALFGQNRWRDTTDRYEGMGAPYRDRLTAITNDPNLYFNSPEAQALARQSDARYSALLGNPAGSGTAQAGALEAMQRGYGAERDRLFRMGGGDYFNRGAVGAQGNQIGAGMGIFNSLGPLAMALFGGMGGGGAEGTSGGGYDYNFMGYDPDLGQSF